ncbi:Pup--protein ligase [Corynebacterium frankenforstense DSM 45800]|uniref:Pup--protein ligase n=1 Tax=Corynebacterium frankenforstense DSM 45800 TaxID=1437875 RepID=A0A1L7CSM8_9CORY|nr:Pup--protein ligase [Corynebacterium frankenforstense]APT88847.1 Pup--protein ligase [Corynebacterium frankenforstense DSM 45800]
MGEVFTRRIMGLETEYGITAVADGHRALGPDEISRYLFRPVVAEYSSSNVFIPNGARLYLDVGAHPEYATAECDGLSQLVAHHVAGDRVVDDLAVRAEQAVAADGIDAQVYLFKNNVDSLGNSYGCHENYLVGRSAVLKTLGRDLMPFLVTRQLVCGAGLVTRPRGDRPAEFLLSQRADQVWESVSSATTRSRPVINTRDEPHADSHRFRRMHVIVGDSNMAEPTTALKVGSMLLMLELAEAGAGLPTVELKQPVAQGRVVARDVTGRAELECADGSTTCALEIQRACCAAARAWLAERPDAASGTSTAEMTRVVELWERALDAVDSGELDRVGRQIDWVIKRNLLERYRDRLGGDWAHPKLAQVDLAYHDIRPGRGLYALLAARGLVEHWVDEAEIAAAVETAPATTRARARGEFLAAARAAGSQVTCDWQRLKVTRPEPETLELADPFEPHPEGLGHMVELAGAPR